MVCLTPPRSNYRRHHGPLTGGRLLFQPVGTAWSLRLASGAGADKQSGVGICQNLRVHSTAFFFQDPETDKRPEIRSELDTEKGTGLKHNRNYTMQGGWRFLSPSEVKEQGIGLRKFNACKL
ncbi:hypothetical protein CEP54_011498 [Fusarium duplospermum]|uniref:Uncharacterized protein n=1 Tax=Fusarium duplospermum TaxID=1325734 RepID=A0A428PED3_9HYPO|nr:hypothetical protein CEP54_011498 [Fusarium duplospermum]